MAALSERSCTACKAGAPGLNDAEIEAGLMQLPGWNLVELDGVSQLHKVYKLPNFVSAMAFAQKIADLAEEYGHHPALLVEWGRVEVRWWTHKIGGLHDNDLIMAAKTAKVFAALPSP